MLRVTAPVRFAVGVAALLVARAASAQDPLVLLPHAYKLVLENEWVKVVRVHYEPRQRLPAHDHTERAAAYVYLNDAGPVLFDHEYGEMTRPATKTGSFRLYKAVKETHSVSNPNDVPSDFLRVEFKTQPVDEDAFRGRFHREPNPAGDGLEKVQFDHPQLRVTRYVVAPGKKAEVPTTAEPALLIALTPGRLTARGSKAEEIALDMGSVRWLPKAGSSSFENAGAAPVELLRFDLKTPPVAAAE